MQGKLFKKSPSGPFYQERHFQIADGALVNTQAGKGGTGAIPLRSVTKVDITQPERYEFSVCTHDREFRFRAVTKAELESWTTTITKEARKEAFADSSSPTSTFIHDFAAAAPPRRGSAPSAGAQIIRWRLRSGAVRVSTSSQCSSKRPAFTESTSSSVAPATRPLHTSATSDATVVE